MRHDQNPKGNTMAKTDAVWHELDISTLSPSIQVEYVKYKQMYAEMKAQRSVFENVLSAAAELPQGKRMVFGYNFGKLSVAVVEDDRKTAKPTPAKQSLADFIASQASAGRRV